MKPKATPTLDDALFTLAAAATDALAVIQAAAHGTHGHAHAEHGRIEIAITDLLFALRT